MDGVYAENAGALFEPLEHARAVAGEPGPGLSGFSLAVSGRAAFAAR